MKLLRLAVMANKLDSIINYYSLIGEFSKIKFILQNYNEVAKSIK
jgi:hypothetical protein